MEDRGLIPLLLPGGCVIFSGQDVVFRPEMDISFKDFVHEHFEISALEGNLPAVDEHIMEITIEFPFTKSRLTDLAIALSEAVNNAITKGPQNENRKIWIDIIYIPKIMLYVFVRDDLGYLDLNDINLAVSDTFTTDESGRGFFIIANLVSVFAYIPGCDNLKEIIIGLEPEND